MRAALFCGGMGMRMREVGSVDPMGLKALNSKNGVCG
jgi:hypothetical protein